MVTITEIRAARKRLEGVSRHTPLLSSPALDQMAGRRLYVKPECLQRTGSFKLRGAYNAIASLSPEARERGIIAMSSGNHAQGVAYAAQVFGAKATIVMPKDAPKLKIENTRLMGAELIFYDRARENRDEITEALAAERGLSLIRPFDDPQVIAGQGTIGLELAEDITKLGLEKADVLCCCGGGGLSAGIALALEAEAPGLRLRTVEPENFDDAARSFASGEIKSNPTLSGSICDAILTPALGQLTFPILQQLAGPGLAVSDQEALSAMKLALQHLKVGAEPGGAVALAAALFRQEAIEGEAVIAIISGGNAEASMLARALAEG